VCQLDSAHACGIDCCAGWAASPQNAAALHLPSPGEHEISERLARALGKVARSQLLVGRARVADVADREARERLGALRDPTIEASMYKLFATTLSKELADASMDIAGPGPQLRIRTEDAPMQGRAESTYRYTVIDTIGGGASEIQKNIIARRGLGLPRNF
jgi:alkylation response protein AidB-like acyl-CoA dehydrogenase